MTILNPSMQLEFIDYHFLVRGAEQDLLEKKVYHAQLTAEMKELNVIKEMSRKKASLETSITNDRSDTLQYGNSLTNAGEDLISIANKLKKKTSQCSLFDDEIKNMIARLAYYKNSIILKSADYGKEYALLLSRIDSLTTELISLPPIIV